MQGLLRTYFSHASDASFRRQLLNYNFDIVRVAQTEHLLVYHRKGQFRRDTIDFSKIRRDEKRGVSEKYIRKKILEPIQTGVQSSTVSNSPQIATIALPSTVQTDQLPVLVSDAVIKQNFSTQSWTLCDVDWNKQDTQEASFFYNGELVSDETTYDLHRSMRRFPHSGRVQGERDFISDWIVGAILKRWQIGID